MKKTLSIITLSLMTAGCVSTGPTYTTGYFPPPPEYTRSYTPPRPHPNAQKVCVFEDRYLQMQRVWVREERCYWR
jgi:hypothetical protein